MATLCVKPTLCDKTKPTITLTLAQQQQYHNDGERDIYHIKQCYRRRQPTISTTNTKNQRTSNTITNATTTLTYNSVLYSLTTAYKCRCFTLMLMGCLLLCYSVSMAAPQSCILCDKDDLKGKDPQTNYEEFLFEHQVTRQDAINALRQLNESFYEGTASDSSCNAVRCTNNVMNYCLGPQFINDHCLCELGHSMEGLPFVPHICYMGEKVYKASVGSCFFYEEVKECCCSAVLAKQWRHISAASTINCKTLFHEYFLLIISSLYLLLRRSYN